MYVVLFFRTPCTYGCIKRFHISRSVASTPPVGNTAMSFILLYSYSPYVSTIMPYYVIFEGGLYAPHFWTYIWHWWITIFFISTVLSMLPLTSVLFCVSGITIGNETGIPSDVLGASLDLCGTIISSLNCSTRLQLTNVLFSAIIEALIVCRNGHENMLLHDTPYPRLRETVTGF